VHFEWSALLVILQLVYLEGILSIDNAAVLGAMVAHLPPRESIPWPRRLRVLRRPVHRLLGGQRPAALKVGLLGAYLGRGAMLFAAAWVIHNEWLLLLGGLYLVYLAIAHFGAAAEAAEEQGRGVRRARVVLGFWSVVFNVELADLAFSLDNVVAAVALSREMWVVLTGVFLGIVTMRFAAGIFVRLIQREPILEDAAYLLVLAIGLELLTEQLLHVHYSHVAKFVISLGVLAVSLLYARWAPLRAVGARMRWLRRVLAALNTVVQAFLRPVGLAVQRALGWLAAVAFGAIGDRRSPRASKTLSSSDPPSVGTHGGR
jgi:tellurite resistance protein TerC